MKIIAVTNRKGGVGKTTMATTIASGLAVLGYRVGLVDTDSQGHAGALLGMPEENGLFDVLIEKHTVKDTVRIVPPEHYSPPDRPAEGSLYLLPAGGKTYKIPYELGPDESFLFLDTLEQMGDAFQLDVIFVDTNPTMSMFDGAIYLATDGFIYVTECERLSFDGIQKAIEQMQNFGDTRRRFLNRESRIIGIIPNKMRANTVVHRHNLELLANAFGEMVWSPVILRTAWTESSNLGEMLFNYAPSGYEATEAWRLVQHTREALDAWQPTKIE